MTPHRLHTVRPLIFEELVLSDVMGVVRPLTSVPASGGSSRLQSKGHSRLNFAQPAEDRDVWQALTDAVEDLLSAYAKEQVDGKEGEDARLDRSQRANGEEGGEGRVKAAKGEDKVGRGGSGRMEKEADFELFCNYSSVPQKKKLPLVRLRVEHTGFSTISASRFGAQFIGKVANPADMILFFRKRKTLHPS